VVSVSGLKQSCCKASARGGQPKWWRFHLSRRRECCFTEERSWTGETRFELESRRRRIPHEHGSWYSYSNPHFIQNGQADRAAGCTPEPMSGRWTGLAGSGNTTTYYPA
jgi:hypothetical protein